MRKFLLSILLITSCLFEQAKAQTASFSNPVSLGQNKCGGGGSDSVYYFNYVSPNLTNALTAITACKPVLKTNYAPLSGYGTKPFSIYASSLAFNPGDQLLYYVWTDYNIPSPYKSYIWRWDPSTCPVAVAGLDTVRTFNTDIGGITFDPSGTGWQLEFSGQAAGVPHQAYMRTVNFTTGAVGIRDTLDVTAGVNIYNVGTGDITLTPSGQMYFIFDNKLFTPDYSSYGGPTHHFKCTYIDTINAPSGTTGLPGLAYGSGDLIASYATGCTYKRVDPVTGDTASATYTYAASKGVYSTDMTQINSGIGVSKKLISVTSTGTAQQYDVVYDVYVKNFGSVALTNVQIKDSLSLINGAANLSNVTASLTSNPAGVALNGGFNGNTNANLLNGSQGLPCIPVANNNFTIRISCRLSNILDGVVYNNSAIGIANGYKSIALRDSSTNGSSPDLNQNDKCDDLGEGQPTPFVRILAPTTPPCSVLSQLLYSQDFGTGAGLSSTIPTTAGPHYPGSTYTGKTTAPLGVNTFTVTNNASNGDPSNWISLTDHTTGTGRMLLVNADAPAKSLYYDTLPVACPGQQYSVSFWAAFIGNSNYQTVCNGLGGFKYPKLLVRIRDRVTGLTITQFTTNDITATSWQQLGMKWVMPSGYTNVILEIINAGPGGCGNDIALDDIQYGICDPQPTVSVSGSPGCIGGASTFTANLTDGSVVPGTKAYQWQKASALAGPYSDILGATSITYTINPVAAADTGKYYRVIVAAAGNILIPSCQYISAGTKLTGKIPSVAATSATRSKNNICPGISVNLGITGGTLGTNATWQWYSGSCGGTSAGSGTSITVSPIVTTTYYVLATGDCNTTTCQSITITISCNIDKDKDGIPDYVESNMAAALQDANSNGIINAYDVTYAGFVDNNNDFINDNFQADGDSDNDGIPNYLDTDFPGRIDSNGDGVDDRFDTDKDGKINMLDLDSDNDGIPDVVEAGGVDTDGDGKLDSFTDADGDGLSDQVDTNLASAYNSGLGLGIPDFDGDGIPNYLDLDSDNDGIPDAVEVGAPDTNNDGKPDGFVDVNGDGMHDSYINATALLKTGADVNSDGKADSYPNKNPDNDAKPNPYDMDSDGDGIVDVVEAGLPDANLNGIVDGTIGTNGWSTTVSAMGSLTLRSTDGDGKPDYLDIDSDNDGIPDNIEGQTTNGYITPTLTDTDGDGLANVYDNVSGFGGTGIIPVDTDMDGTPDYRDQDSDADGQPDVIEGNDFNMNGISDDVITLTNTDTDGDGLDNRFDSLNSTTNIKGTSYRMGNGGSFTGDATPGARCPLTKKLPADGDRAWRWVGSVLPVQFLQFGGVLQVSNVLLNWSIITPKDIDHFELERSTDNAVYKKIGTVKENVLLNQQQSFGYTDDVSAINTEIIYYRLKVIGKAGDMAYSNVLVVRRTSTKTPVNIVPNPAQDYVSVRFFAENESTVTIRLIDNLGKAVKIQEQKVLKGNNTIQVNNLFLYSNGVYSLQVMINGEVVTQKLVLAK